MLVDLNSGSGFAYGAPSALCDADVRINMLIDAALEAEHPVEAAARVSRRQPDRRAVRSQACLRGQAHAGGRRPALRPQAAASSMPVTRSRT